MMSGGSSEEDDYHVAGVDFGAGGVPSLPVSAFAQRSRQENEELLRVLQESSQRFLHAVKRAVATKAMAYR